MSSRDYTAPYHGGVSHFDGERWSVYSQGTSPLPHNQVWELTSRRIAGGYEVWIGTASEATAVLKVSRRLRRAKLSR